MASLSVHVPGCPFEDFPLGIPACGEYLTLLEVRVERPELDIKGRGPCKARVWGRGGALPSGAGFASLKPAQLTKLNFLALRALFFGGVARTPVVCQVPGHHLAALQPSVESQRASQVLGCGAGRKCLSWLPHTLLLSFPLPPVSCSSLAQLCMWFCALAFLLYLLHQQVLSLDHRPLSCLPAALPPLTSSLCFQAGPPLGFISPRPGPECAGLCRSLGPKAEACA